MELIPALKLIWRCACLGLLVTFTLWANQPVYI